MSRKPKPKKAAQRYWIGYCRKSTETEDRQVHSLEDQASLIRTYYERLPAQERQHRPLQLLEEAQSAYRQGRPVFAKILHMARQGAVFGMIVVHPNRVSRNHADSGAFVQHLVDGLIECLDTTTGKRYTPADSSDIFMLTLEGAMSWKDSRDKGDRILGAMHNRTKEGKYMTLPPVGYKIVYQANGKKSLQHDPENAPIVRTLFDLASRGSHSLEDLTAEAYRLGLRSRKQKQMHKSCLHKLLTNPFFHGQVRFDGIVAKGIHEPLVSEELWKKVQRVLSGKRPAVSPSVTQKDDFVFRGLLQCPHCPRKLCVYRAKGKYVYYECKNPRTDCGVCVPQSVLLDQLDSILQKLTLSPEDLESLRQRLLAAHGENNGNHSGQRQQWSEEVERLQKEMASLFAGREEAVRLGIADAIDARLEESKRRRDELRENLESTRQTSAVWVEEVIRALELVSGLRQAIRFAPPRFRELALKALGSNYRVEGKKLLLELRSPFRLVAERDDVHYGGPEGTRIELPTSVDEARTESARTLERVVVALEEGRAGYHSENAVTAVTRRRDGFSEPKKR